MKKHLLSLLAVAALVFGSTIATAADDMSTAPKSVIHIVTVSWKPDATEAQIQAALDGAQELPKNFAGIKRVWTKTIKAQGDRTHAIVMEFADEQALKDYHQSPAQQKWYEVYTNIRDRSTTFDVTN